MSGVSQSLREIHRLRKHARDLQAEIDRAPVQFRAQKNRLAKCEAAFAEAQDALKHLKVTTHEREVTLKSTHQQIARYEQQTNEVTDSKAFEALKHEIAAAKQKAQTLEDAILDGMAQAEDQATRQPELEAAAKKVKVDFATFEGEQKERLSRLSEQLRTALGQLKEAEERIPDEFTPHYQRLVNAYGADALAAVEGKSCTQCHTQITTQQNHDVLTGRFVCCTSCGRGLYLPE